jgi:hypothetical protein
MRGATSFLGAWANVVGDYDDNTVTWGSFPINEIPTNIPGSDIVFTPNWTRTRQTVLNSVTVLGHNDTHETTQTDATSIATYGEYWAQQFFPAQTEPAAVEAIAAQQLALRKDYKQTLTINPVPERAPEPFIDYGLGDRVPVWASNRLRQAVG